MQQVNCTPLLPSHNQYSVLRNYYHNEMIDTTKDMQSPKLSPLPDLEQKVTEKSWRIRLKWEQQLPSQLIIASTEDSPRCLKLKVEIETTNTAEVKSVKTLVDSGATGEFINQHYIQSNWLRTWKLMEPIPVYNVDGSLNEAGSVMISLFSFTLLYFFNPHSIQTILPSHSHITNP